MRNVHPLDQLSFCSNSASCRALHQHNKINKIQNTMFSYCLYSEIRYGQMLTRLHVLSSSSDHHNDECVIKRPFALISINHHTKVSHIHFKSAGRIHFSWAESVFSLNFSTSDFLFFFFAFNRIGLCTVKAAWGHTVLCNLSNWRYHSLWWSCRKK